MRTAQRETQGEAQGRGVEGSLVFLSQCFFPGKGFLSIDAFAALRQALSPRLQDLGRGRGQGAWSGGDVLVHKDLIRCRMGLIGSG